MKDLVEGRGMADVREAERLALLEHLDAARPEADPGLQGIVDDVRSALGTDLALINLVLPDERYFRAWSGELPEEYARSKRLEREHSVCAQVMEKGEPLVVEDFLAQEDLRDHPFRVEYGTRFYAGVPLVASGGIAIGTVCVAGGKPMGFGREKLALLEAFARAAVGRLELLGALARERRQKQFHESLLEAQSEVGEGLVVVEEEKIVHANEAFSTISGYGVDELYAMPSFLALVPPEERAAAAGRLRERLQGRATEDHAETTLLRKDGRLVSAEVGVKLVRAEGGTRLVVVVRDVTERKRSEENTRFQARLLDAVGQAVMAVDLSGKVLYWNRAAEALYGWSAEEALGQNLFDAIVPEESRERSGEIAARLRAGEDWSGEFVLRRRDGSTFPAFVCDTPVFDEAGEMIAFIGVSSDITERKRGEEELRAARLRYQELVDSAEAIIWRANARTFRFTFVSHQAEAILGYPAERWTTETSFWSDHVHPDDRERALAFCKAATAEGRNHAFEYRTICADGRVVWLRDNVHVLTEGGVPTELIGVMTDITERKEAEQELDRQWAFLRRVIDTDPNLVFVKDWDGRFTLANRAVADLYGTTVEELVGRSDADFNDDHDELEAFLRADREVMETLRGKHIPKEVVTDARTGEARWFQTVKVPLAPSGCQPRRVLGVATEITMRKRAEEALKESEERFRALVQNSSDVIVVLEGDGAIRHASPSVERVLGFPPEGLVGKGVFAYVHPEDAERVFLTFGDNLRRPGVHEPVSFRLRHADGSWRCVEAVGNSLLDRPEVGGVVVNCRDVTDRVETETRLREAEERFRTLAERIPVVTYIGALDYVSTCLYMSPRLNDLLGYSSEERLADPELWVKRLHPEDRERVLDENDRSNHTGEPFSMEYRMVRRDGRVVWVRDESLVLTDEEGRPSRRQGYLLDVTERREAEEELRRSEERYRTVVERTTDVVFLVDLDSRRIVGSNPALQGLLGFAAEELRGMSLQDLVAHDPDDVGRTVERILREGSCLIGERRYRRKDGATVEVEASATLIPYDGKRVSCCVARDVTERKRAEEALRLRDRAVAAANNGIIITDPLQPDNPIVYVNPAFERTTGYAPEEALGKNCRFLHGADRDQPALEEVRAALREGRSCRVILRNYRKDGTPFRNELRLSPVRDDDGRVTHHIGVQNDVTDRERAQDALRESEERYRAVVERTADGVFLGDFETNTIIESNAALRRMLGYAAEELRGMSLYKIIDDDPENIDRNSRRTLEEGSFFIGERRYRRKDGATVEVEASATLIPYGDKEVACLIARDVTERKRSEEELLRSEARNRAILEAYPDLLFRLGRDGEYLDLWASEEATLYVPREEIVGGNVRDVLPPDVAEGSLRHLGFAFETGETQVYEYRLHMPLGSRDYEARFVATEATEALCIVRDVTERKRAEEELKRSLKKLSAINEAGRLLGSTLDPKEIAKVLSKGAKGAADLAAAAVLSHDEQGGLREEHVLGAEDVLRRARSTPEAREALRAAGERGERRALRPVRLGHGGPPLAVLCVPLRVRDRVVGVLEACGPEPTLGERTVVQTLTGLANQAASALENARLYAELAEREGQLKALVGELIMAQEEERRRVAREVHDGLTQMLVAAHQHLQSFADYHPPESPNAREELEWVMGVVQRTVGEARRVIADLRPTALDDFGLATALRLQADALRAEGWEVEYEESLGDERLPPPVETALFRVAQEALSNVRKHAGSTRANVALQRADDVVRLRIRDWGRGFSPDSSINGGSTGERVGLSSMRERVVLLGGRLDINGRPGAGTSIAAEIPLLRKGSH